mgnify:CR=1 FL=1|jgi:VanZ family protein|tara:strand:+ start:552 stop:929 length:378 start_codon:yes stop_codon:yes gene_type:complete
MISWFEKYNKVSWIITILITIVIFYISSITFDSSSGKNSINAILYHIIAFFFFALFLSISSIKGEKESLIFLVFIISIIYGGLDEFHQFFVPGRYFSISDIFLDTAGISLALIFYISLIEYRRIN